MNRKIKGMHFEGPTSILQMLSATWLASGPQLCSHLLLGASQDFHTLNFLISLFRGPFFLSKEQVKVISINKLDREISSICATFSVCLAVLLPPSAWTKLMCRAEDAF